MIRLASIHNPPPGGKFFFDFAGEHVEAPTWYQMEPRVRELLARHGSHEDPELAVAAYMCPHMPEWFCAGDLPKVNVVRQKEATENAVPYFRKRLVPVLELERRLEICRRCPKHEGGICLTCTGILNWILRNFGGRRPASQMDHVSRVCSCARTYESVIASVEHGDDPVWEGIPPTCWRNEK